MCTQYLAVLHQSEAVDVTMKHFSEECQTSTSSHASDPTRCSQKNGAKNRKSTLVRSPGELSQK